MKNKKRMKISSIMQNKLGGLDSKSKSSPARDSSLIIVTDTSYGKIMKY